MAATVLWREHNGTGVAGTMTDKTSGTIRFKNADNATVDLVNPMVKGTAADFSFEKYTRFFVSAAPTSQITNGKWYTDGTNGWTGVNLWVKTGTYPVTGPVEGTGTAGYVNAFNYTSGGSQIDLALGTVTGTGMAGTYVIMQMEVGTGASGGVLAGEQATISWDEI
jgi:hypothetical protein